MPKLTALERFYYAGRNVEMGETFVADQVDVDLLTHAIKPMAKVADRGEGEPEPEPVKDKPVKDKSLAAEAKPKYKTREMKAED